MTATSATTPPAGPSTRLDPAVRRTALVLVVGVLAVAFDSTIVNVALDTLSRELHAPLSTIQWVTTGYVLALAMAVPVTGWLTRRLGGKTVWLAALTLFLVGSLASSVAWSASSLIVARVVQGVGGGIMLPVLQNLVVGAAGRENLSKVMGVVAMPAMLGPILGPVLGGVIVQHLDWRWIFWVNVPFCVVGWFLARRYVPAQPRDPSARLDGVGLALLSPGIAAVIYGLSRVAPAGGFAHAEVLVPVVAGLVLSGAFVVRALRLGGRALVDLRLFRSRTLTVSSALLFLTGFALLGAMLLLPLYCQQVRGESPTTAGLVLAAQGVGLLASRPFAARLTERWGYRTFVATGFVVTAAATAVFTTTSTHLPLAVLLAALVVRGAGLGAVTVPLMAASYLEVEPADVPHASILTRTTQQLGGSFGTAVLAVVLESAVAAAVAERGPGADALAHGYAHAFWWATAFTLLGAVVALWLPGRRAAADR
ncbi:MDR family MFS transporter [Luteimicrobium sp. DT211]|uniref:MDR family MFS transporter n=1 Tax=Luteimicrobium sp. DT211 TaxID=3393412 RepID=UPI003CFB799D